MGPSHDVQKHDTVILSKILPRCVTTLQPPYIMITFAILLATESVCLCADDGEQVLVDVEGKDHKEISQHVKKILGKSE